MGARLKNRKDSNGRGVCDMGREGSGVDAYIARAVYVDDGSDVPEDELDYLARGECLCWDCWEHAS